MKFKKNTRIMNRQDSVSKNSEKKGNLLIEVNELMEKLENDYGPLMLGELQKRLKKTIEDFHDDVSFVLKDTFDSNKMKHQGPGKKNVKDLEPEEGVPSFIAEYQNKKNKK